jgi:hypothetical protein
VIYTTAVQQLEFDEAADRCAFSPPLANVSTLAGNTRYYRPFARPVAPNPIETWWTRSPDALWSANWCILVTNVTGDASTTAVQEQRLSIVETKRLLKAQAMEDAANRAAIFQRQNALDSAFLADLVDDQRE